MKKVYEKPEIEVIEFNTDFMTCSGEGQDPGQQGHGHHYGWDDPQPGHGNDPGHGHHGGHH